MSQAGGKNTISASTITATSRLTTPVGQNLLNTNTRTLAPSLGAIAYDINEEAICWGETDHWVAVNQTGIQGPIGPTGLQGVAGAVGATGAAGLSVTGSAGLSLTGIQGPTGLASQVTISSAYLWWNLAGTTVTVPDQTKFLYNGMNLPPDGSITYTAPSGNVNILYPGRYLINWGYHENGAPSTVTSLFANGALTGLGYTMFSLDNATDIFETQPNVSVIYTVQSPNTILSIVNNNGGGVAITFPDTANLPNTAPDPVVAYLTIVRLS